MKKESNKNVKDITIKILLGIVFCFFVLYVLFNAFKFIRTPTDVLIVKNGKISSEESVEGYVIRNEIILEGENYKNGMIQIKNEGERVAKDENVFRYYSNSEENLKQKISELDDEITDALSNETDDIYSSDIEILEKQIDEVLVNLHSTNDIQKINKYNKDINSHIEKKSKIASELSTSSTYISQLMEERNSYEEQLNNSAEIIQAPESGIVSYKVDEYENILGCTDFSYLNSEILNSLDVKVGAVIENNDEKGKIVNNFVAYIAIIGETERALATKVGNTVTLRLSNLDEIQGKVVYVKEEDSNRSIIVFEINDSIEYLVNYRKISMDIVWWSDEGKKVSNSSIIEENDLSYVIRKKAGYLDKILIKVLRQNETYSIVDNYTKEELEKMGYTAEEMRQMNTLKLYDEIVYNPTKEMLQ